MGQVQVGDQVLVTDSIVIATGAEQKSLGPIAIDGQQIWGAREAMTPTAALPARLLIVGAGAIGVEFASFLPSIGLGGHPA